MVRSSVYAIHGMLDTRHVLCRRSGVNAWLWAPLQITTEPYAARPRVSREVKLSDTLRKTAVAVGRGTEYRSTEETEE